MWQQRQRSAQLLAVAAKYGTFPVVLETMRECLQDVFDVPGLTALMRDIAAMAKLSNAPTPRMPDGKPDFNGVWVSESTVQRESPRVPKMRSVPCGMIVRLVRTARAG